MANLSCAPTSHRDSCGAFPSPNRAYFRCVSGISTSDAEINSNVLSWPPLLRDPISVTAAEGLLRHLASGLAGH